MSSVAASTSRARWLAPLLALLALVVVIGGPLVASYNSLVNRQADVERSFADLDVQLQRRSDLVPNLVAAVRGALNQEQAVFGELARARTQYAGARTPGEKFDASNELSSAIGRLLVIVESYPQLRSNENIRDLQVQIEGTENRIAQARRDYNAAVTSYNVTIRRFPRSLVAGLFGFDREPLFEAGADSRTAPRVDLGVPSPATG